MTTARFQTKEELIQILCDHLTANSVVTAAYLFGSQATGKARAKSDIDIAVLYVPGLSAIERFDQKLIIAAEVERLTGKETDIVDLISAPLFLQYEIRRTGCLILDKDKPYRVAFEVQSRKSYFDFKPLQDRILKSIVNRY